MIRRAAWGVLLASVCAACYTDDKPAVIVDTGPPSLPESTDTQDTACDSPAVWYADVDGDGYGAPDSEIVACEQPEGAVSDAQDCDDDDPAVSPAATEACNDVDDDCDSAVDEAGAVGESVWYADADADGVGDSTVVASACDQPVGYVSESGDCDDSDAEIAPGVEDQCANGVDDDCDGSDQTCALTGEHLLEDADVMLIGEEAQSSSTALRPAGDVNGDGVPDILVGAWCASIRASFDGAAFLVLGPAESCALGDCATAVLVGEEAEWSAGQDVAPFGDLDGDGYDDVMVGDERTSREYSATGTVYLVLGPVSGELGLEEADMRVDATIWQSQLGNAMEGVGDIDGDGVSDLLVGASGLETYTGAAYLFYGPTGVDLTDEDADLSLYGSYIRGHLGEELGAPGDTDGDGLPDLVVAEPLKGTEGVDRGAVYVLTDPGTGSVDIVDLADPIRGESDADYAGGSVSAPGDHNGDGYADLLVTASEEDSAAEDAGAAYLLLGPMSGYDSMADAWSKFTGVEISEQVNAAASGEDTNGDGYADLILGADDVGPSGDYPGKAYLVLGPAPEGTTSLADADGLFRGDQPGDEAGERVAFLPDWNGDGYAELLVGADGNDDGGEGAGAAYIIHGAPD